MQDAMLIPQRAVTELQGKAQVAVVGSDNKVQIRVIQLGPSQGTDYVVENGLKPGERVVVEGLSRAIPGMQVTPKMVSLKRAAGGSAGEN
jgi:membrane fusion protein (multidrug efflux system)